MLRRHTWCLWIALAPAALFLAAGAAHASLVGLTLRLRADPPRVPADGESSVVISVEVLDALGRPVPDGTPVHFVTTLGDVVSPVETVGGFAQTVLEPSNAAGTAVVSAVAAGQRQTIEVEFLQAAGSASPGARTIELTAEELSYSADKRVFVASWDAVLRYQSTEIRADGLQYDMTRDLVCAQGNVVLRSGARTLSADALRYYPRTQRGRLLRVGEEAERLAVEGELLQTRPDPEEDPCLWSPMETDDTRTWVKARRAIIEPNVRVILDDATFYVDDARILSLPRHVLNPMLGGMVFGDSFGYSSANGVSLNFPYYYAASGDRVGSLHLKRNRSVGGFGYEPGWCLGLKEEYVRDDGGGGSLALEDVFHPDRGITWEHRQQLGRARVSLDASALTFDDEQPQMRSLGARYSMPMNAGRFSLSTSGSHFGGSRSYFGDIAYRFGTRSIGSGVLLSSSVHLRHSRHHSEGGEVFVDPVTGESFEIEGGLSSRTTSPGASVGLDLPSRQLGGGAQLNASLSTGYAWGLSGGPKGSLDGRLGLVREFGRSEYVRLSYTYSSGPTSLQPVPFTIGRQRVRLAGNATVGGAGLRFNASKELDGERLYGTVMVHRGLPFGRDALNRPLWRISLSHMFSHLEDYAIASTRLGLHRAVGQYRASIYYSPQGVGIYDSRPWIGPYGVGYTYSGGRHVWIELSAAHGINW